MEIILIRTLQLMLCLTILVTLHELGHFVFARLFKVRVEKFRLFFDPWFALFSFKPKGSDTDWGIGWLPLGGYVKISGMIDESMDTEQMMKPAQPWEFRSKPAWQRLLIMIGGVTVNFIAAFVIYSMILLTWGEQYVPLEKVDMGMSYNEAAIKIGFQDGDILLRADDEKLVKYDSEAIRSIVNAKEVHVLRNGQEAVVNIPEDWMLELMDDGSPFADYRYPCVVDSVAPNTLAASIGMKKGAEIVGFGDKDVAAYADLRKLLVKADTTGTTTIAFMQDGVRRQGEVKLSKNFQLGIYRVPAIEYLPVEETKYNLANCWGAGIGMGVRTLKGYVSDMRYLFSEKGAKSVGGFGTIAKIFPPTWDWYLFWKMTAFISIILGFMNILPIPALDGGHVLFLVYEMIAGKKPSDKFMEWSTMIGIFLLFGLMIYANLNDIIKAFF